MSYANIISGTMVLVVNTETGADVKFFKGDAAYDKALELVKARKFSEVFNLDIKNVITTFFEENDKDKSVTIKIDGGVGKLILHNYNNMEVDLADAITQKIMKMKEQGFDAKPLANFLANLYRNPSQTAINELYSFIEACNLPITEDGHFIAYKIVRNDYKDIYTGKMDNSVGKLVAMPRGLVDDNRQNTCSRGLHFCSKDYLNHYGSSSRGQDRCMLVKINPANVVSIPSDYNNAKGRASEYVVVSELTSGWRDVIPGKDYTDKAVVDTKGQATVTVKPVITPTQVATPVVNLRSALDIAKIVNDSSLYYSICKNKWFDGGMEVGRRHVKDALKVEYTELDGYQNYMKSQW